MDMKFKQYGILKYIASGYYPAKIAKQFKWSRPRVAYHLKRLEQQGYIEKLEGYYPIAYKTTDKCLKFLAEGESNLPYDIHNIQISIPIKKLGSLPKGALPMKNWLYSKFDLGNYHFRVHYGKQPKLIVRPPKEQGKNPTECLSKVYIKLGELIPRIERNFYCELARKGIKLDMKPHFHPKKDPLASKLAKQGFNYAGDLIQINQSEDDTSMDLVGVEAVKKYENMLNTPEQLAEIASIMKDVVYSQKAYAEAINKHLEVLGTMNKTLKAIEKKSK